MSSKRKDGAMCGRLISLASADTLVSSANSNPRVANPVQRSIVIEFPAMPDEFTLRRSALYTESPSIYNPDGLHTFTGVNPLHIDFSFRLHQADRVYCPNGPYTLLEVAAYLHALILPIQTGTINPSDTYAYSAQAVGNTSRLDAGSLEAKSVRPTTASILQRAITRPTTCQLELMETGPNRAGILCRGYVKDVSARFLGPFLRGKGNIYNLPTAAEYSFTFVHVPGYQNAATFDPGGMYQALAKTVRDRLYNTRDLIQDGAVAYQGIEDIPSPENGQIPLLALPIPKNAALPGNLPSFPENPFGIGPTNSPADAATGGASPFKNPSP